MKKLLLFFFVTLSLKSYCQPPPGYHLIFQDDFTSLTNGGAWWINDCIRPSPDLQGVTQINNVQAIGGDLRLTVDRDFPSCPGPSLPYSFGYATSSARYLYGYFEFRAKFDPNKNIWPALWFRAEHSNEYLEIDLMEACGTNPGTGYANLHEDNTPDCIEDSGQASQNPKSYGITSGDYNVYGIEWTPGQIKIFVNGNLKHTYTNNRFFGPHYVIMNAQVGDYQNCLETPPTSEFPMHFYVDYFKAYQKLDASFYIKGPDFICLNDNTDYIWPYYEPFSSHTVSLTPGLSLTQDPTYAFLGDYPAIDPMCQIPRNGVYSFFTVKGTAPGQKTISVNVDFDSGYSRTISKTIWAGPPPIDGYISSSSYNGPVTNSTIGIASPNCTLSVSANKATSFSWTQTGGNGTFSGSGSIINISGLGTIALTVTAQTSCGTSTRTFFIYNYGGSYRLAPNPAQDYLDVIADPEKVLSYKDELGERQQVRLIPGITEIEIFDTNGKRRRHKKLQKRTKNVRLDLQGLKTDTYFVVLHTDDGIVRKEMIKI